MRYFILILSILTITGHVWAAPQKAVINGKTYVPMEQFPLTENQPVFAQLMEINNDGIVIEQANGAFVQSPSVVCSDTGSIRTTVREGTQLFENVCDQSSVETLTFTGIHLQGDILYLSIVKGH